eukprot:gnl/Dysnectes_brevis/302_a336_6557.p1 GENE.gnl/Dysnectes_brevis/302_a336_6557~~gnl/Dysnectes_brevis/302_a336_6557.p1  ORF type:complete len:296 (-),score=96.71 gnl/Dysnectes_brevis/302_a336_6557:60-947(-)
MKLLFALAIVAVAFSAPLLKYKELQALRSFSDLTWTPGMPKKFIGKTEEQFRAMLMKPMDTTISGERVNRVLRAVPSSFDSRDQWPGCIGEIRDQDQCGSCWAFGSAESFSDRHCITKGGDYVTYSPQYIVSCDSHNDGCDGGNLNLVWRFLGNTGTVVDSCMPYTSGTAGVVPKCPSKCKDGSAISTTKSKSFKNIGRNAAAIASEIYTNGPVEAAFTVYTDFQYYTSGIYSHVWGRQEGGHAIKVVGWGTDEGTDYWLVANSWGPDWGESGFFRIVKGTDECGIEDDVVAGMF